MFPIRAIQFLITTHVWLICRFLVTSVQIKVCVVYHKAFYDISVYVVNTRTFMIDEVLQLLQFHWAIDRNSVNNSLQYIPRNMHTVFAFLCFVVVIHWLIFPYPSGLLHWHCGNLTIAPVPAKQPWWIWIFTSCEFIMNDCITTTKQSTTKPCAYFLGYTVASLAPTDASRRREINDRWLIYGLESLRYTACRIVLKLNYFHGIS